MPIGVIGCDITIVTPEAVRKGMVRQSRSGTISISPKLATEGLRTKPIHMAAALADERVIEANTTFIIPSDLLVGRNVLNGAKSVPVDFGDGLGFREVMLDTPVKVAYQSGGTKAIRLQLGGRDEDVLAGVDVKTTIRDNWGNYGDNSTIDTLTASIPYEGIRGNVEITYLYRNNDRKLRKPIIVVDGFDDNSSRTAKMLFEELNSTSFPFGNMVYSLGYDLVILDFPKIFSEDANEVINSGADYINRNALSVVKAIEIINAKLVQSGSNNKLVVIGPSMGGLITRYALRYMELNSMSHRARLWVSFDSPQNGANIPIGVQGFASIFDYFEPGIVDPINAPAARQMLIHHYLSGNPHPTADTVYGKAWRTTINSIGYPMHLRRIAVANGSMSGTTTHTPSSRAVNMTIKTFFGSISVGGGYVNTTAGYGQGQVVVAAGTANNYKPTTVYGLSGSYSIDNASGGTFNSFEQMRRPSTKWYYRLVWDIPIPIHNFIPTKSALGFTGSNPNLCESLSSRNLVATGETPFQSYWGPVGKNMQHVSFNQDLALWLLAEIEGYPQQPRAGGYSISGPDRVCGTSSFSIASLPTGCTLQWSCSPQLQLTAGQGASTATFQSVGAGAAWVRVVARVSGVQVASYTKNIEAGAAAPQISAPYNMQTNNYYAAVCAGVPFKFHTLSPPSGVSEYRWWLLGGDYPTMLGSGSEAQVNILDVGTYTITCKQFIPGCGWSAVVSKPFDVVSCGGGGQPYYSISPNPASSAFEINPATGARDGSTETAPPITSVQVVSQQGQLVISETYQGAASVTVGIAHLRKGIYVVRINGTEKHTLAVE